ncbi:heme o synthase [Bacillaceae bacterium Marseille-Q3522]|nr:heme o synthase [Bacillaceae bacterium Marseille-Q3522]
MSNPRTYPAANKNIQANIPETTAIKDFFAVIKMGIVNSNLMTAFTGLWLALYFTERKFLSHLDILAYTMLGTAFIVAGSCALNNFIDRDIDPLMERTKARPTVTGKISTNKVAGIGWALVATGLVFLCFTSFLAVIIGIFGIFSYVVLYTMWSKRKLVSNTIIGSISGAIPPLIGWAAVEGSLSWQAWVLFFIVFIWQPPHFYSLAMRRAEEYRTAKIPMLPVVKGFKTTKKHIFAWICCLFPLPFFLASFGIPFLVLATLLTLGWLITGIYANKYQDDIKWAKMMFIYSLQYLTILFVAMVIFTLI